MELNPIQTFKVLAINANNLSGFPALSLPNMAMIAITLADQNDEPFQTCGPSVKSFYLGTTATFLSATIRFDLLKAPNQYAKAIRQLVEALKKYTIFRL